MRYEAKNAYIKRCVGKNFKNLPHSVATRHQNFMCLQLLSLPGVESSNFLYKGDEIGKGNLYMYVHTATHIAIHNIICVHTRAAKPGGATRAIYSPLPSEM